MTTEHRLRKRDAHKARERWERANPGACTRSYDGVCRCPHDKRPQPVQPHLRWRVR